MTFKIAASRSPAVDRPGDPSAPTTANPAASVAFVMLFVLFIGASPRFHVLDKEVNSTCADGYATEAKFLPTFLRTTRGRSKTH
jgi:hypothetical protein